MRCMLSRTRLSAMSFPYDELLMPEESDKNAREFRLDITELPYLQLLVICDTKKAASEFKRTASPGHN